VVIPSHAVCLDRKKLVHTFYHTTTLPRLLHASFYSLVGLLFRYVLFPFICSLPVTHPALFPNTCGSIFLLWFGLFSCDPVIYPASLLDHYPHRLHCRAPLVPGAWLWFPTFDFLHRTFYRLLCSGCGYRGCVATPYCWFVVYSNVTVRCRRRRCGKKEEKGRYLPTDTVATGFHTPYHTLVYGSHGSLRYVIHIPPFCHYLFITFEFVAFWCKDCCRHVCVRNARSSRYARSLISRLQAHTSLCARRYAARSAGARVTLLPHALAVLRSFVVVRSARRAGLTAVYAGSSRTFTVHLPLPTPFSRGLRTAPAAALPSPRTLTRCLLAAG